MGMHPYGKPTMVDRIYELIHVAEDGSLWHDMKYFAYHYSRDTTLAQAFGEHFGRPARDPKLGDKSLDPFYCDVAASIQKVTEEILFKMARFLRKETGSKNLCLAGGVALNSVANYKIWHQERIFDDIYVHPAPGDDGGAVGAAYWAYNHVLGQPRGPVLTTPYLGSEYSDAKTEASLRKHDIAFEKIEDDQAFYDFCARSLMDGMVCGWFAFGLPSAHWPEPGVLANAMRQRMLNTAPIRFTRQSASIPTSAGAAIDASGEPLPAQTVATCRKADAVLLGAVGGPKWDVPGTSVRPELGLLGIEVRLPVHVDLHPPLVFEDGRQRRDFVHVRDVARACRLALEAPEAAGKAINIGSGESRSVLEVANALAAATGNRHLAPHVTGKHRAGDIRHCFADISLARRILGFEPQVAFEDGLADLADWLSGQIAVDAVDQATEELSRRGLVA